MSRFFSVIRRLFKNVTDPGQEASVPVAPEAASGVHPDLTDQELVVLLTAAAYEVLDRRVRVERFRPLTAKDWSWIAQGRMDLHTHRLK